MPTRLLLAALLLTATAQAEQYATVLQFPAGQKCDALVPGNSIHSMSIDGGAAIRDYPWSPNQWHPAGVPDPTGVDSPQFANGYSIDGDKPSADHVFAKNIPGTGLLVKGSVFGTIARASWVDIHSAINGVDVQGTDVQLEHVNIDNIVHESLMVHGGGNTFVGYSHLTGGDIGYHFFSRVHGCDLFADNERIGGIIESPADMTEIDGYAMRDCWERGLVIKTSEVNLSHLSGNVPADTTDHTGAIGVELVPNVIHAQISGALMVGEGGKGLTIRGSRNDVKLIGKWTVSGQKTSSIIKYNGAVYQTNLVLYCPADTGPVIDATTAQLDETDTIELYGSRKRIVGDTGKATVIIHEVKK